MILIIPTTPSAIQLARITMANNHTRICVFPDFLTAFPIIVIPAAVPKIAKNANQKAKSITMNPLKMNKMAELKVANIAMNIEVPDATVGGTPKSKNRGVNRIPPLRPTAPEINPAIKAKTANLMMDFESHTISPLTNWYPQEFFSTYSLLSRTILTMARTIKMTTWAAKKMKSAAPHLSNPAIDFNDLVPLKSPMIKIEKKGTNTTTIVLGLK